MKRVLIYFTTILILQSCVSFKGQLTNTGGSEEAIQNAILDFSNTSRLYKKDSIFSVSFYDTLYRMVLENVAGKNSRWVRGNHLANIVSVSISGNNYQFLLTANTKVGSNGKLPSRTIEKNGKLFYWWDEDYPLTEQVFTLFKKYHLFQDDMNGVNDFPSNSIDDAKKGVHYYFCRNNLSVYKKIITNTGIGYYDAPKLKCD
jgi:hypothetical protein